MVVVDAQGTLLSGEGDNALARSAGSFLQYKSSVETYLGRKAEDMLAAVLGPNRATVRVSAVVETTNKETVTEKFSDPSATGIKEESSRSNSNGVEGGHGGRETEDKTLYHEPPRTILKETIVPGEVKSLEVAVAVDLSAPPAPTPPAGGGAAPAAPAGPKLTLKQVEDIVKKAIGLKETDTLTVVETPFYSAGPAAMDLSGGAQDWTHSFWFGLAKQCSLGVLVVGALVALKMMGGRRKGSAVTISAEGAAVGSLPVGEENPEQLRSRITRALQENPDEVKRLFLDWVESGKGGV